MNYPMTDPVPPGHGEPMRGGAGTQNPSYGVVVVLGDGVPNTESRWPRLNEALDERDHVKAELQVAGYTRFFVGVQDDDDPERGWLDWEDDDG